MGVKLLDPGIVDRKIERFVFETPEERKVLENARSYFHSIRLLINKGLGYNFRSNRAGITAFYHIRNGQTNGKNKSIVSISVENWKRTQEYAERHQKGERYDPETFVRPEV